MARMIGPVTEVGLYTVGCLNPACDSQIIYYIGRGAWDLSPLHISRLDLSMNWRHLPNLSLFFSKPRCNFSICRPRCSVACKEFGKDARRWVGMGTTAGAIKRVFVTSLPLKAATKTP